MKRTFAFLLVVMMILALCGCGAEQGKETAPVPETTQATDAPAAADLQALYEMLAEKMPEMIVLDETMMLDFCGISPEDCTEAVVATCADGLRTDEVWLIQAADEDALGRLKEMAETRLRMKGEESITYSPEQYAVVEKAELVDLGLYLILIVSPDVDELTEIAVSAID